MFKATIMTSDKILYDGLARSVFLPGAAGEFEILDLHRPIVSLLKAGSIVIDNEKNIPVKSGAVRMSGDEFVAIVEE